jgi:hypothetical protein
MTVADAAAALKVDHRTIRNWIHIHDLDFRVMRNSWRRWVLGSGNLMNAGSNNPSAFRQTMTSGGGSRSACWKETGA